MLYTAKEDFNLWLDNFYLVRKTEEHFLFFSSNFFVSTPCINIDVRYYLIEIIKDGRDEIIFNVTIGPRVKYMM